MPELEAEMSTEIDGQLFIELSALTDGESFDVVMSKGGDHGYESWRKLRRRWDPYTAGRARCFLRERQRQARQGHKESVGCWNCGKRGHYSKDCWSKKNTNEGGSKGKHKFKNASDAHNLDSTKPANVEPEVEISGIDMDYLDVDTVEVQEFKWIKIGVDTGAGKTAWLQSVSHTGRSFLAVLTSLAA